MVSHSRRFAIVAVALGVATASTLTYTSAALAEESAACPEVFAHGGYPKKESDWDKEQVRQANNPKALQHYKDVGAAGVEADLQLTREGTKAVMWHNRTTNNLSGARAAIPELWWAEGSTKLKGRTIEVGPFKGEKVNTLREYLDAANETKMVPLIELKNYDNTPLLSSDDTVRDRAWDEVIAPLQETTDRQEIMVYSHDDDVQAEAEKRFKEAGVEELLSKENRPVWPDTVDWNEPPPSWKGNEEAWQKALDKDPKRIATDWPKELHTWLEDKCE